jgi:hypothetical protein
MITSGNGLSDGSHIYITSWTGRLRQKAGCAVYASRTEYLNVWIVMEDPCFAPRAAGIATR